eukprot:7391666-Prymnesium_polylepis.1
MGAEDSPSRAWVLPESTPPVWKIIHVLSTCVIVGEAVAFLFLFSEIFYGSDVVNKLSVDTTYSLLCVLLAITLFAVLYVLDFTYWTSAIGVFMRRVGMTACMGSIAIGALLYTDQYPELPMAVLYLLIPLSALVMRWVLFHEHSIPAFLYTMCLNFILASLVSIVIWLVWITDDNYWTTANKDKWSAQLGCAHSRRREPALDLPLGRDKVSLLMRACAMPLGCRMTRPVTWQV